MIDLATWQHILDRRNNKLLSRLHRRILDYAELKRQWGYGHIQMKRRKCKPGDCKMMYGKIPYHTAFYGYYVNLSNQKRKVYLGFSFRNVFLRLEGKKASLFGPFE